MATPAIEHVPTIEDYDNRIAALDDQIAELESEQADIEKQIAVSWDHPNQTALLQTRYNHIAVLLRGGAIRRGQLVAEREQIAQGDRLSRLEALRKDQYDKHNVIEGKKRQIAALKQQIEAINREIASLDPELTLASNRFHKLYREALNTDNPAVREAANELLRKYPM